MSFVNPEKMPDDFHPRPPVKDAPKTLAQILYTNANFWLLSIAADLGTVKFQDEDAKQIFKNDMAAIKLLATQFGLGEPAKACDDLEHGACCWPKPCRIKEASGDLELEKVVVGTAVRGIINDYHKALDNREHGDAAAHKALERIEKFLDMPWKG